MRLRYLMNVEGGSNGGGAAAPQTPPAGTDPAAAAPAAGTPPGFDLASLKTTLDAINTRFDQQSQIIAQLARGAAPQQAARQQQGMTQEEYDSLDDGTKAALIQQQRQTDAKFFQVQDQMDLQNFRQLVEATKPQKEALDRANQIWNQWNNSGRVVAGPNGFQPPTRYEALQAAMGELAMQGKLTQASATDVAAQQEALRQQQNAQADIHRPGVLRTVRVDDTKLPDPDKLTPAQRVEQYHSNLLDANGGW